VKALIPSTAFYRAPLKLPDVDIPADQPFANDKLNARRAGTYSATF
jgi:hypothetical protein